MDVKKLLKHLRILFNDSDIKSMTFDNLQAYYEKYTNSLDDIESSIEEAENINETLMESIQTIENSSCFENSCINDKLEEIKALLEDISDLVDVEAEKLSEEDNNECVDTLESVIPELKIFLEEHPEFEKKPLLAIYNYGAYLLIEENMKGIKESPDILTSRNIKEIVEMINMPSCFGYCTQGIHVKIAHENDCFSIIIPFGAKVNGILQPDLFGGAYIGLSFEWGDSYLNISGAIENPYVVYREDDNIIPLDKMYTREEVIPQKE